jgi:hypothetical protein
MIKNPLKAFFSINEKCANMDTGNPIRKYKKFFGMYILK